MQCGLHNILTAGPRRSISLYNILVCAKDFTVWRRYWRLCNILRNREHRHTTPLCKQSLLEFYEVNMLSASELCCMIIALATSRKKGKSHKTTIHLNKFFFGFLVTHDNNAWLRWLDQTTTRGQLTGYCAILPTDGTILSRLHNIF